MQLVLNEISVFMVLKQVVTPIVENDPKLLHLSTFMMVLGISSKCLQAPSMIMA
jgi:hypothetical protein